MDSKAFARNKTYFCRFLQKSIYLSYTLLLLLIFTSCQKLDPDSDQRTISFNSPTGGEAFIEGASYNLSWNSSGVQLVDIVLVENGGIKYKLAESLSNTGIFRWNIEQGIHSDTEYYMRIFDSDDETIFSELRQAISILPAFETSSFIDSRDGREYRTVKIGDDWWMAENFRYETEEGSMYYNELDSLGLIYGRLYSFDAAWNSAPEGWHLPSDEEWLKLELLLGIRDEEIDIDGQRSHYIGDLLKVDGGTGFDALYGGYYNTRAGRCGHIYQEAHLWTSSYNSEDRPIIRIVSKFEGGIIRLGSLLHGGCSVRYVKDK